MLLLAVDTSGKHGSIALAEAQPGLTPVTVLEIVALDGGAFSAQLVPEIAALLQRHGSGRTKRDISAFAVVTGPGSFTGLRVGLAAIKALADSLQKPIVAISLLEALARQTAERGRVLAILDAGRNELYVGDYEIDESKSARMSSEQLLSRAEFIHLIQGAGHSFSAIATSDDTLSKSFLNDDVSVRLVDYPHAGVIAQLGWERFQRGEIVGIEELEPNYIRNSIASKPKAEVK